MSTPYPFVPLPEYTRLSEEEMKAQAEKFYTQIKSRRTIREFSEEPIPTEVINHCLLAAGTAPNGANLQPWHFAVVQDPKIKKQIREAAEVEEREFYNGKAPQEWLDALAPLGTDENKPFLETAPVLIVLFSKAYDIQDDETKVKNYYSSESVGIATGFLINALHSCGLGTLTHTPSPMKFLNKVLDRPANERPFLLLVVGFPAEDAMVPVITKKTLDETVTYY